MFTRISLLITLSVGFSLLLRRSPIILNALILILSLSVSVIICLIICSWLGYVIFLIYVRGILVIFIYFSAIQPNQRLYLKRILILGLFFLFSLPLYIYPVTRDIVRERYWHVSYLFNIQSLPILFILGIFLFVALVVVIFLFLRV